MTDQRRSPLLPPPSPGCWRRPSPRSPRPWQIARPYGQAPRPFPPAPWASPRQQQRVKYGYAATHEGTGGLGGSPLGRGMTQAALARTRRQSPHGGRLWSLRRRRRGDDCRICTIRRSGRSRQTSPDRPAAPPLIPWRGGPWPIRAADLMPGNQGILADSPLVVHHTEIAVT